MKQETLQSKRFYRCSKCKKIKELSGFYKDRTRKSGHQLRCKSCCDAYGRSYREQHIRQNEGKQEDKLFDITEISSTEHYNSLPVWTICDERLVAVGKVSGISYCVKITEEDGMSYTLSYELVGRIIGCKSFKTLTSLNDFVMAMELGAEALK